MARRGMPGSSARLPSRCSRRKEGPRSPVARADAARTADGTLVRPVHAQDAESADGQRDWAVVRQVGQAPDGLDPVIEAAAELFEKGRRR